MMEKAAYYKIELIGRNGTLLEAAFPKNGGLVWMSDLGPVEILGFKVDPVPEHCETPELQETSDAVSPI